MPTNRPLLDLDYRGSNFTTCMPGSLVTVTNVYRHFNDYTSTYELAVDGQVPGISFPSVASTGTETSIIEIGFWPAVHEEWFVCTGNELGCVGHGPIRFEKKFVVPQISFPLADIACRYQVVMETTPVVCLSVAPIGYQNHTWQNVFTYVPLAIVILAILVSVFHMIRTRDLTLAVSEYAMDLHTARFFKSSTMADVIWYAQFVTQTGALNLLYPQFYRLFTANFRWSWLLVTSPWISSIVETFERGHTTKSTAQAQPQALGFTLHMDTENLFLYAIIVFSLIVGTLTGLCGVAWATTEILAVLNTYRFGGQRQKLLSACIGLYVRLVTLFYVPLTALAFYQLMLRTSWFLVVTAILLLVTALFGLYCHVVQIVCGRPQAFFDIHVLLRYGILFNALRPSTTYFFVIVLVYRLLISAMIGLFQMSGETQVAVVFFLEATLLTLHLVRPPFREGIMNFVATVVATFRTAISALNFCFLSAVSLSDRERQYVAYTQICLHFVVFMIFLGIHLARLIMSLDRLPSDSVQPSIRSSTSSYSSTTSRLPTPSIVTSSCLPRFRWSLPSPVKTSPDTEVPS